MKNILVFPCGSEIALEIYRSLQYSTHFNLIGASSVADHGEYVYENYIANLPFHNDKKFIPTLQKIIQEYKIDAIYPAMDLVAYTLKENERELETKVIGSSLHTNKICSSKKLTYEELQKSIPLPKVYKSIDDARYPLFIKPDIGYGSRNTFIANSAEDASKFLEQKKENGEFLLCEYLPHEEYTIDCFSSKEGELLFYKARQRARISNGISVNTIHTSQHIGLFAQYAKNINEILKPRGAWFFQMKEDTKHQPKLLEVAARLGGSSSLCRAKGVNFAMLTLFDAFDFNVSIEENNYSIELDRALSSRYRVDIKYATVYVDYDDCILLGDRLNTQMLSFLFKALNEGKKIVLITRHAGNIEKSLEKYRIKQLFDSIVHIDKSDKKSLYVVDSDSIFIDDSFAERKEVAQMHKIPVFSPDMIEVLL